ncbi:MAG: hypothetical protein ACYS8W_17825 [Planctomycetota bacterium]|jgi:hypothetical protein
MRFKAVIIVALAALLATLPSWGIRQLDGKAYAKGVKAQRLPKDALGFSGMIRGIVKGKTKSGIIFWVGRIVEVWKHSKAKNPESLIGLNVLVIPNQEKGRGGKVHVNERHVAFMRLLKEGDEVSLDVRNFPDLDGNECLRMLELTKEQREWLEKGKIPREEREEKKKEEKEREKKREHEEEKEGEKEKSEKEEEEPGDGLWKKKHRDREEKEREKKDRKHEEKEKDRDREKEEKEERSREKERDKDERGEKEHEWDALPDGMVGFSGMLGGKVVGKVKNGFILHVKKILKLWKGNEAENPESAIGKNLVILAQWKKGDNGKWHPIETHLRFINRLEIGQFIHIEVRNDEGERLHILELSEEQRKK